MTIQTDRRAGARVLQRGHAGLYIILMTDADTVMAGQPTAGAARATMTGLAAHAIGKTELAAPRRRRLGMTPEALLRILSGRKAKALRDGLRARAGQNLPGLGMGAHGRACVLPGDEFVLPDRLAAGREPPMTGGPTAGADALMRAHSIGCPGRLPKVHEQKQDRQSANAHAPAKPKANHIIPQCRPSRACSHQWVFSSFGFN